MTNTCSARSILNMVHWLKSSLEVEGIIFRLRQETKGMTEPMSFSITSLYGRDPFLILISCLLSSRTKDIVVLPASLRLFTYAKTPSDMLTLPVGKISELIFPVGFYREKAKNIHILCNQLITEWQGLVPCTFKDLITLRGVGAKTANLVLGVGFGIPALCVDTHVHKICNRLGLVQTKSPEETEAILKEVIPQKYWIELNRLLVMWGQNICVPRSPFCSSCVLSDTCPRNGVSTSR